MASNAWSGLASGIERGLGIGNTITQMRNQEEDRAFQKQQQELGMQMSKMQMETLMDSKKREELKRSNQALLYSLMQMKTNPEAYGQFLQSNPEEARKLQKYLTTSGNFGLADTGKAGKVDMIDLVPQGTDQNGEPLFGVAVKTEDGKQSMITNNRQKMSEGDTPKLFSLDDLGRNISAIDVVINKVESDLVSLGDTGPIERMRASSEATRKKQEKAEERTYEKKRDAAKYAHEDEAAKTKFGYDKKLISARNTGRALRPMLRATGRDPETGAITYSIYNEETGTLEPVGGGEDELDFNELPPEQQDALAEEDLVAEGVVPDQETWVGLGKPVYSVNQLNAAKARRALGGLKGTEGEKPPARGIESSRPLTVVGNPKGLIEPGNLDLLNRPSVKNGNKTSSVFSTSIEEDGKEVLIPQVSEDGRLMNLDEAVKEYRKTGNHLGKFDSVEAANAYAKNLHLQQQGLMKGLGDSTQQGTQSQTAKPGTDTQAKRQGLSYDKLFSGIKSASKDASDDEINAYIEQNYPDVKRVVSKLEPKKPSPEKNQKPEPVPKLKPGEKTKAERQAEANKGKEDKIIQSMRSMGFSDSEIKRLVRDQKLEIQKKEMLKDKLQYFIDKNGPEIGPKEFEIWKKQNNY